MSLNSTNYLSSDCNIDNLYWIIEHLDYEMVVPDVGLSESCMRYYHWVPSDFELLYVGVELSVYKGDDGQYEVRTRSRMGSSIREVDQQNNTIRIIHYFFGGTFETNYGEGIYFDYEECNPEKTEISRAMYIQRCRFHNALVPMRVYSDFMNESFHKSAPAGDVYGTEVGVLPWADYFRPFIYSANILLPYIVGAWESFVKNSYLSILKYTDVDKKVFNPEKLTSGDLERIRKGKTTVEDCIVEKCSFQKPGLIISNYKGICRVDVKGVFEKPYKDKNLRTIVENLVNLRNKIVHEGYIQIDLTHDDVSKIIDVFEEAVDRLYGKIAKTYDFEVNPDFQ